jgi:Family of unknown function (DUF6084)
MPDLNFHVEAASVVSHAMAPTLAFKLRVENRGGEDIRSIMLKTQIQIAPILRHYNAHEQERLFELYGPPAHWANSLKTLLLANTVELVPAFSGGTVIDLSLPCTYDFEVASSKYFHGLQEGDVPLEFLFSGSVFYAGEAGLQIEQIPWDKEDKFRLPIQLWKEMMERYFPNSAWLRLRKDTFDKLYAYKASRGMHDWDTALNGLLKGVQQEIGD